MKVKKLLAGFLSAAMVLGTMSFPVFAEGDVASIGDTTYTTLAAAVEAANANDTIMLVDDTTESGKITITDKTINIDFDGHTLNGSILINGNSVVKVEDGYIRQTELVSGIEVAENSNVTINNMDVASFRHAIRVDADNADCVATAVINGGKYVSTNNTTTCHGINIGSSNGKAVVTIYNGEFYGPVGNAAGGNSLMIQNHNDDVKIYGGYFAEASGIEGCICPANGLKIYGTNSPKFGTWSYAAFLEPGWVAVLGEDEKYEVKAAVAKIENNYYATLADALSSAQDGNTVTILSETNSEALSIPALTNVTIEGAEGIKPMLKNVYEVNAGANNVTFSNIEFSQTEKTLKIQGKNITFKDCDFNAKTLGYWSVQSTQIYNGYSDITTLKNAENITFENCKFDGVGTDGELPNARLISGPSSNNLTIKNCSFTNAFSGIYYGNVKGSYLVEDSYFDVYAYTTHNGGDVHADTFIIRNTTLNGWTSYAGVGQTTFENCKFGGEGVYHTLQAYNNTEINNCTFSNNYNVYAGNQSNFNWSVNNSMRNGEYIRRPDQFFAADDLDWTYQNYTFTFPSEAKVIDTAKTTGVEITLNNLNAHENVDINEDATYKVVVSTAPADDAAKANEAIAANTADTNTSKAIFDISVIKTDSYGVETDLGGDRDDSIKNQKVTLTLGETPVAGTPIYVYHVKDNGTVENIATVTADGTNKVTFTAPSFSTYAATYTATALAETEITKNIGVEFKRIADTSSYDIVLKANDGKTINRFMSTDLTFDLDVKEGAVGYAITPAANINLIDNGNDRYEFNLDGLHSSGATGTEVTIGTVTFDGYGKIDFEVNTTVDTNIVNTATLTDNIVDTYTTAGDGTTTGLLDLTNKLTDVLFTAPKKDLTVNVQFNNIVSNQVKAYQDMKVTISGGDLATPIVRDLGSDGADVTFASDTYTTVVADTLTQNNTYTVTVTGAGYRTTRYTVTMTEDKTLNFWNNVKNTAEVVEVGSDISKAKNVTFLAGEIVKDNNINIYDLSAVVSYFGTVNDVNAASAYSKYDLNRDGKIDSKDVAYVLVSWGK